MSTYTDIRYDYNLPSSAGGAMKLISEQTASASASISFTSGIDSTYRTYLFKFINIHPASQASFTFNMSTDGGSNYNVTKTSTNFRAYHAEDDIGNALSYVTSDDLANSTAYQITVGTMKNDNDASLSGELYLFSPSSTTFIKNFLCRGDVMQASPAAFDFFVGGFCNTVSAINAIDFKMSSGNIDAGVIKMYGIA